MGFIVPHITIIIATGSMVVALVFQLVGVAANGWIKSILFSSGLWEECIIHEGTTCHTIGISTVPWLMAVRAFGILGLVSISICLGCAFLIAFKSEQKMLVSLASCVASSAALSILIEFAVYAGEMQLPLKNDGIGLGYCFALTVVAFILCGVAAVLFLIGRLRFM